MNVMQRGLVSEDISDAEANLRCATGCWALCSAAALKARVALAGRLAIAMLALWTRVTLT